MIDVYHHFTYPSEIGQSLSAALKPGGRLAVVDFEPRRGSAAPAGVPASRGGHGIPPEALVAEVTAAGLSLVKTTDWSDQDSRDRRMFLVLFRKP